MTVEHGQVYHRVKISGLLWNKKQSPEEAQEAASVDWLYGPLLQAGCPWPSVDLVSCSWLEKEWASLSKEADDIPTTGHPTAAFLMICTRLAGFPIAWQKQLGEPPLILLHCRAPPNGPAVFLAPPPLVLLLGFLGSGPPVMRVLEMKLLFHDLFCCPFSKDWLLTSWPTGGPSL